MGIKWKQWKILFSWTPKSLQTVTADIKRHLLLGRKPLTNLDSILKSRDITLLMKVHSQNYGFSCSHVWIWELDYKESWVPKNRCFWTVVLEKTLESPLSARRSNQSILKEISFEYSLEGLMLKLKLQHFGHLMRKADSLQKTPILGKIERNRRGQQSLRWLDGITTWWTCVWASYRYWWWRGKPGLLQSMGLQRVGHNWTTELNWIYAHQREDRGGETYKETQGFSHSYT